MIHQNSSYIRLSQWPSHTLIIFGIQHPRNLTEIFKEKHLLTSFLPYWAQDRIKKLIKIKHIKIHKKENLLNHNLGQLQATAVLNKTVLSCLNETVFRWVGVCVWGGEGNLLPYVLAKLLEAAQAPATASPAPCRLSASSASAGVISLCPSEYAQSESRLNAQRHQNPARTLSSVR